MRALDRQGVRSKIRLYEDGKRAGGHAFSRGALYALLSNPVYIGEIRHKTLRHPGLHEPMARNPPIPRIWQPARDPATGTEIQTDPLPNCRYSPHHLS